MLEDMIIGAVVGGIVALVAAFFKFLKRKVKGGTQEEKPQTPVPKPVPQPVPEPAPQPRPEVVRPEEPMKRPVTMADAAPVRYREVRPETVYLPHWELVGLNGQFVGQRIAVKDHEPKTMGRGPECDIRFAANTPGVSSVHCRVDARTATGTCFLGLTDLGSTYGTYIGAGLRLNPHREELLHDGDTFSLAQGGPSFRAEYVVKAYQV